MPEQVDRLVHRLEYAEGQLMGLVGPRGVGKSRALRFIAWKLTCLKKPVLLIGLRPKSQIYEALQGADSKLYYNYVLAQIILEELKNMSREERYRVVFVDFIQKDKELKTLLELSDKDEALRIIFRNLDKFKKLFGNNPPAHTILIDLPDYPGRSRRALLNDLDQVQSFWRSNLLNKQSVNIVITLQEEAFNPGDHFLFGKMLFYRLKPFKPDALFHFFKKHFPENPFTDDALLKIARASGGNFRSFKTLIAEILEAFEDQPRISGEMVENVITPLLLNRGEDWLRQCFRSMEQRELALKLLEALKSGANQRQAAQQLGVSEATVSRILSKLRKMGLA